jgi:hypothetical protein
VYSFPLRTHLVGPSESFEQDARPERGTKVTSRELKVSNAALRAQLKVSVASRPRLPLLGVRRDGLVRLLCGIGLRTGAVEVCLLPRNSLQNFSL